VRWDKDVEVVNGKTREERDDKKEPSLHHQQLKTIAEFEKNGLFRRRYVLFMEFAMVAWTTNDHYQVPKLNQIK
jgi:hypothetical protein